MNPASYLAPTTLEEASGILRNQPEARLLAGGQTLLLSAHKIRINGAVLVDLGKIKDLAAITLQPDGGLQIGSMTTIDALMQDQVVSTQYPALARVASDIGDAQLRNRATVGGTLADASPESDLAALFLALDATIAVANSVGRRSIPIQGFFSGDHQTVLDGSDIITSVNLPAAVSGTTLAYERIKHPATLYALAGVAAVVSKTNTGAISFVRIAATGAMTFPARLKTVEQSLIGKQADEMVFKDASSDLPADLEFRSDLFGSGEYRRHLVQVLTRRALVRALSLSA